MTEYQLLLSKRSRFLSILDDEIRIAEEILPSKHAAATIIQRAFRGSSLRAIISKQMFAAGEVQRLFRAAMGRKRAHANDEQKQRDRHLAFLHYLCIQLQRSFRGYYSRKYKHDQHRRKLYCRMIAEKNEEVLEKMRQYNSEQAEHLEDEARERRKQMFESL
eukprot:gene35376-42873_t